ncbi:MAG: type II secretion system F family protein [Burkholderiales bacterium]|nr:type II secretion system F family protein [Burkholderiales bacterium]
MEFSVRALDPETRDVQEHRVEAADLDGARRLLRERGWVVLSARGARMRWAWPGRTGDAAPGRRAFPMFCRELRTLIQAGMTVVEAVDTLSARERQLGRHSGLASALRGRLEQGQALSVAMAGLPGAPPVLVAAIRSGERTSNLREALDDYLRFNVLVEQLRAKVISSAIYPAIVMTLGIAISLFLLIVVLPNFSRMYQNLRGVASGGTAAMIALSQWVSDHRGWTFAMLGGLLAVTGWWAASGGARRFAIALARRIPWLWARFEDFQLAMMYQALALLLRGGYAMTEALTVAGQSALSTQLRAGLARVLGRIEQGGLVSQALHEAGLADEVGRRLMAAAERNGEFHVAAAVVSQMHAERFEIFVERMTRVVEPLLLMVVAVGVGGIVVMMYLPVFDMATGVR